MKLRLWQVDAFARRVFEGNPAAVVPLDQWIDAGTMQAVAQENNLAETAFILSRGNSEYDLRWFTPSTEVPMCGHATLASAWVIFAELAPDLDVVHFATKSGILTVERSPDGKHRMALPAGLWQPLAVPDLAVSLGRCLSVAPPAELYWAPTGAGGISGVIALWSESDLRSIRLSAGLEPLLTAVTAGGLLATARAEAGSHDFVSRFFAPGLGVPEDPVTGSMHATLAPFWATRLGKNQLHAFQASQRGGDLLCRVDGAQVVLSGPCALYLKGEIEI